jgi:hypothetical protein
MSQIVKLLFALLCLIMSTCSQAIIEHTIYDRCYSFGMTSVHSFVSSSPLELSYTQGPTVLVWNRWLRVVSYASQKREQVSYRPRMTKPKFFIEFFNENSKLPLAVVDVDALFKETTEIASYPLFESLNDQLGYDESFIRIYLYTNFILLEDSSLFISYPKYNLSMYVHRTTYGDDPIYTFGIRALKQPWNGASGACVLGFEPLDTKKLSKPINKNFLVARQLCDNVFSDGIAQFSSINQTFKQSLLNACASEVSLTRDSFVALNYLYNYWRYVTFFSVIFEKFIFEKIYEKYPISNSSKLKQDPDNIKLICSYQKRLGAIDEFKTAQFYDNYESWAVDNCSEEKSETLSVGRQINDAKVIFRSDEWIREAPEFNQTCAQQASTSKNQTTKLFLFHPTNRSLYIECDELGKAFVKRCPQGLVFTDNFYCAEEAAIVANDTREADASKQQSYICESAPSGSQVPYLIPHPIDGRMFIECYSRNQFTMKTCEDGKLFNRTLSACA